MRKSNLLKKTKDRNDIKEISPKEEKIKKSKNKKPVIPLPIIDFDEELQLPIMEDGSFCDFLEIITKDLQNISEDQLQIDKLMWEKLFDTYPDDLKIVSFSFPASTMQQQRYLEYILEKTKNPGYKQFLQMRLEELVGIPKVFLMQSFILVFYAKGYADYKNKYINIMSAVGKAAHPLVRVISAERKKAIIGKLCNKNLAGDEA